MTEGLTTPPSEIKDFAHLPLHRGGSRFALQRLNLSTSPVEKEQVALWKSVAQNLSKGGCGKVILLHKQAVEKKLLRQ